MEKEKIVILAAGKGTRMKSELPKALAPLGGKPMISHVLSAVNDITPRPVIIIGHQGDMVKETLGENYEYAVQEEQLGTGHALLSAEGALNGVESIVVLSSDQPFVKKETILECLAKHRMLDAKITFAVTEVPDFEDWRKYFFTHGRILREGGEVVGIREYKDASEEESEIKEVNTGCCYVFDGSWLWENLRKIKNDNSKSEYYLTDLIELAHQEGARIEAVKIDPIEALGANSKEELEVLEKFIV